MSSSKPNFIIKQATSPGDLAAIRSLFTAYAASLPISLSYQNFSTELFSLPGLYTTPTGCLLVAFSKEGEAIGCAALRPLPLASSSSTLVQAPGKEEKVEKVCEMKRLYCVPESRGMGLGRALVDVVIAEAERLGYEEMRLDTLPTMEGARRLYEGLGFVETERYYETPIEGTLFLAKSLGGDQGEGGV